MHPLWDKGSRGPLHSLLPVIPSPPLLAGRGRLVLIGSCQFVHLLCTIWGFLPFAVLPGLWQARKLQLEQWES